MSIRHSISRWRINMHQFALSFSWRRVDSRSPFHNGASGLHQLSVPELCPLVCLLAVACRALPCLAVAPACVPCLIMRPWAPTPRVLQRWLSQPRQQARCQRCPRRQWCFFSFAHIDARGFDFFHIQVGIRDRTCKQAQGGQGLQSCHGGQVS